jgi:hypothetical protein
MDMRKYSGSRYVKLADVEDGSIEGKIAGVKEGQYGKPDLYLDSGQVLSLNATNNETLCDAYGFESDRWIAKTIRMLAGDLPYQNGTTRGVVVKPISPPIKKSRGDMDDEIPYDDPVPRLGRK